MNAGLTTIIYPVKDLARAKVLYSQLLGTEPYIDQPYYVGFRAGGQEIGLDPHGHAQGMTAPIGYVQVTDIRKSLQLLTQEGAQTVQDVRDVGGGKLIATVRDADGNVTGLMQNP